MQLHTRREHTATQVTTHGAGMLRTWDLGLTSQRDSGEAGSYAWTHSMKGRGGSFQNTADTQQDVVSGAKEKLCQQQSFKFHLCCLMYH